MAFSFNTMDIWNSAYENNTLTPTDTWATEASDNGTISDEVTSQMSLRRRICVVTYFYATSFIAPIGITGNVFSIVVFLSATNFCRTSTVQYFIGLAVTDSLYLVGQLFYTLSTPVPGGTYFSPINFVHTTDFGCKSIMWLRYRFQSAFHDGLNLYVII